MKNKYKYTWFVSVQNKANTEKDMHGPIDTKNLGWITLIKNLRNKINKQEQQKCKRGREKVSWYLSFPVYKWRKDASLFFH